MKYTFNFKKSTDTNKSNNNSKNIYATILNYYTTPSITTIENNYNDDIITYNFPKKEKKTINIDLSIKKSKPEIDIKTFSKAFTYLLSHKDYKDTYDFKAEDGTPIKLFADEIQIGYELIPLNEGTKRIYDMLSAEKKKNIIDIYINITK